LLAPLREELERAAAARPNPNGRFLAALGRTDVAVIAEVKRRSPSAGEINGALQAGDRAAAYAAGGAAALSVLTEPGRFGGSGDDIRAAHARVGIPILRKDFIVDTVQLVEARALGAAAALLIVRALDQPHLVALVEAARALGLEPLLEVRDARELARALAAGARVIGVNSRDLETLQVDAETVARVIPTVPRGVIAVAESGLRDAADVERAALVGADAVLVGSALSAATDPVGAVAALTGVSRHVRGGGC
jgi:indole-3-glycerol phosphate synthase